MAAAAVKLLVPRIPLLLRTAVTHTLSLDPNTTKWDLKSTLIITAIKDIMAGSKSTVSAQQAFGLKDPGVRKNELVVKDTFEAPEEDDIRELLWRAIDSLCDPDTLKRSSENTEELYEKPDLVAVEAEWTSHTIPSMPGPGPEAGRAEQYFHLESTTTSPLTILYFHGGAYYLMDPSSHRSTTSRLAKMTGGKVLSVRYRLAPKYPFPAALLDAFITYMSLLYPGKNAIHEAVKAEKIIFAGDSAGGGLSLSLLLLILWIRREGGGKMKWNGRMVEVPVPGGVATNAAWSDVTRSSPSYHTNAHYDYLPAPTVSSAEPTADESSVPTPKNSASLPPCPLWPQPPLRADLYSPNLLQTHPLISPLAATESMWAGRPPMYFSVGEEMLADEVLAVARRCAHVGENAIVLEHYEAMPHCFPMLLDGTKVSDRCFESWAEFCKSVVAPLGSVVVGTKGLWIVAPGCEEETFDVLQVRNGMSDADVTRRMKREMESRITMWEEAVRNPTAKI